jgi:hypothetical protein
LLIHDALILLYIGLDDQPAQLCAADIGILGQGAEEAGVGPPQRRLGLLGGYGVAGMRR